MNVLENNLTLCYNVGMSESISEYYDRVLLGIKTVKATVPKRFRKQEKLEIDRVVIDSSVESYQTVVILNDRVVVREDDLPNR